MVFPLFLRYVFNCRYRRIVLNIVYMHVRMWIRRMPVEKKVITIAIWVLLAQKAWIEKSHTNNTYFNVLYLTFWWICIFKHVRECARARACVYVSDHFYVAYVSAENANDTEKYCCEMPSFLWSNKSNKMQMLSSYFQTACF